VLGSCANHCVPLPTNTDNVVQRPLGNSRCGSCAVPALLRMQRKMGINGPLIPPLKLYLVYSAVGKTEQLRPRPKWFYKNLPASRFRRDDDTGLALWLTAYPFRVTRYHDWLRALRKSAKDRPRISSSSYRPARILSARSALLSIVFFTTSSRRANPIATAGGNRRYADVCLLFFVVRANFNTRTACGARCDATLPRTCTSLA